MCADEDGCHVVWDTEGGTGEVYYVRYDPLGDQFLGFHTITEPSTGADAGRFPKILEIGDRLVVSFVTTDLASNCGASRDAAISNGTPVWDASARLTPTSFNFSNQSIAPLGDYLHMLLVEHSGAGSGERICVTSRPLSGDWDTPAQLGSERYFQPTEELNPGRQLVNSEDSIYAAYCSQDPLNNRFTVEIRTNPPTNWSSDHIFQEWVDPVIWHPTISASATGQYAFWVYVNNTDRWMARRVRSLIGSIAENMFWTGNNWVSDDVTIESEKTVTAWAGSVTTVLANKKIIVAEGATLIVKDNAQFKFEPGASIDVQGSLIVQGTVQHPAIFTSTTPSGSWSGIDIGASATDCSIDYAHFSNASTAITVP